MDNISYLYDRNHVVEQYLYCIDRVIRRNWALMRAACMEYDDVYQQLAVRLIRCVDSFDPEKGNLEQHICAQLNYELLNCKRPHRLTGITGAPKDFRKGNIISLEALSEDSPLFDRLAA